MFASRVCLDTDAQRREAELDTVLSGRARLYPLLVTRTADDGDVNFLNHFFAARLNVYSLITLRECTRLIEFTDSTRFDFDSLLPSSVSHAVFITFRSMQRGLDAQQLQSIKLANSINKIFHFIERNYRAESFRANESDSVE
jgi:hypothetical protein